MGKTYSKLDTEKESISGRVLKQLRQDIIAGRYPQGSRLLEIELAQTYGASRGTIRSALQELSNEGLVEFLVSGGCVAVGFTEKIVQDIYDFRCNLELQAGKILLSEGQFSYAEMVQALDMMLQKESQPLYQENAISFFIDVDIRFHQAMVYAAGNRPIYRAWCSLSAVIRTLMQMNLSEDYWKTFQERFYVNHKEFLDLAILKDPALLETIRKHTLSAVEMAVRQLKSLQREAGTGKGGCR